MDVLAAPGSDSLCALELPADTRTSGDNVTLVVTNVDVISHMDKLRYACTRFISSKRITEI